MSFSTPRGRHRAPSKLNSTARASVVVAATGGIAAAIAIPSASASTTDVNNAQVASIAAPKQSISISSELKTVLASVASAKPQLGTVQAESLIVRAERPAASQNDSSNTQNASDTEATSSTNRRTQATTSRSTTRIAVATSSTARSSSNSNNSSASTSTAQSGASTAGVSRSGAVGIAMNYLGVPYVFGGSSPSGFDCSGLTGYVYRQLGVSLPRTAAAQQSSLRSVSNPQPGDLVFFGYPAHHVGIYAGNGMMIAAPYPGSVVRLQKIWDTPSGYGRP